MEALKDLSVDAKLATLAKDFSGTPFSAAPAATAAETQDFKSLADFEPTTDRAMGLTAIKVNKYTTTRPRVRPDDPKQANAVTLAYVHFSLVLDNGMLIPVNGVRLKQMPDGKEPFISIDGYKLRPDAPWTNIVALTPEQKAHLGKKAIRELAKQELEQYDRDEVV